ncbi:MULTISPECIES: signal recognition particle-docking protein FtsY [Streptomyces]|uniref:Signal recognition particle receptor FtsY n=1 Tax=Streptomyces cinereoruber TaxID=67260 RepID=A0AAV4KSY2_9ACTN|nr:MULTISPECIES: signal recognition particle-docking protein FtsY [Streptomyces]AVH95267.1 signal recognition particle-docking protein FtsY [Streptomyces sp. WAC00288]KYG53959.1 signal recognition particle-docking protein FtsY [Streptomyces sp. WAC04657]MBB4158387.1 fused signal recognition particle receptor [Streptomyces cinereoruber]MBY8814344.1 signal recognition particle-docking protein FtsY [Streptomyces cinereoruber]NIH59048.1 fused signal recognition particle receptor [Streptomyces cine
MELILAVVIALVVAVAVTSGLVISGRKKKQLPPAEPPSTPPTITAPPAEPHVGEEAETPREEPRRTVEEVQLPTAEEATGTPTAVEDPVVAEPPAPVIEVPEPTAGRLVRLRARLARSQNSLGKGLLTLLSREHLDEDTWEEIEETLLTADVGVAPTQELVERLRERVRVLGTRTPEELRGLLREELITLLGPDLDRTVNTESPADVPGVVMVVGVNGTGKTTTTGKLARVLVADGKSVVLGAADTFRAAAADQLQTWGERVGARTIRGPEGGDPASIAFDAVKEGIAENADVVLIDTAGRLHTKTGLMDELGKVKRVVEKHGPLDEILLVLDATTGQNGLIQARVFAEVVDITGIVLTKLDGTAKGGIVIAVQRELGVPVKLIGLGEGPDDLAPFEPGAFVDALIGD